MGCSFSGLNALYDAVNGGGDVWINENRFKIVRQLGEGGFAYVFLVKEILADSAAATGGGIAKKCKDSSHISGSDSSYHLKFLNFFGALCLCLLNFKWDCWFLFMSRSFVVANVIFAPLIRLYHGYFSALKFRDLGCMIMDLTLCSRFMELPHCKVGGLNLDLLVTYDDLNLVTH